MHLGNYHLVRKLGRGGMADIYLARQRDLDRYVAIKLLDPDRVGDDARALFLDEARLCTLLCHQNVAIVYDIVADGDATYIAMEYIDGADLSEIMRAARARYRDVSLSTIMVTRDGAVKVSRRPARSSWSSRPSST